MKIKKLVPYLFFIILVGGIVAGLVLLRNRQSTESRAESASMSIVTPSSQLGVNQEFTATVYIDTKGNSVSAADVELTYDPTYLDIIEVTKGDFLPTVLIGGTGSGGNARIVLGCLVTQSAATPKNGNGILAYFRFKTKTKQGNTTVNFSNNTAVAAIGSTTNVLGTKQALSLTVGTPKTASPTPTASPTKTASPTASPTATSNKKPGDVNGDNTVNVVDIGIIIDNYGSKPPTDQRADLVADGIVNILDIGVVIDYYGS